MPKPVESAPILTEPLAERANLPALVQTKRVSAAPLAWAVLVLTLVALLGSGIYARDSLIESWPRSIYLYDLVGLGPPVPWEGLELRNVQTSNVEEEGQSKIVVTGQVVNTTDHDMRLPKLRAKILGRGNRELDSWTFSAPAPSLPPGESMEFKGSFEALPEGAESLQVGFEGAG